MEKSYIKENFPRLTSSTRLVLIMLTVTISVLTIYALVNKSQYFSEIFAIFAATIASVCTYFFNQRWEEHKTFATKNALDAVEAEAKVEESNIHDTSSLPDIW